MNINGKTVLVTGGAGAIGSNLVEELLNKYNCKVLVIDDLSSVHDCLSSEIKERIEFYHTSILNEDMLENLFNNKKIDIVFHLAALFANQKSVDQPREDLMVNGMGTLKLLQFAQKNRIEKFVFTSSSCVYGNKTSEDSEEDVDFSLDTPYAVTKLLGEKYCEYFNMHYHLPTVVLRIFNCYGPGELPGKYRNVIPNFFKLAMEKKPLQIYGTGNETRDYTYVKDIVQGIILAAEVDAAVGEVINLGFGGETKVIDLAKRINELCGNDNNIQYIPPRNWDTVMRRKANIDKAKRILGYNPKVNIDEGLKITSDWFHEKFKK